jgi:O-methyltransferase involved in polyketide biosynthesis
VIKEMKGTPMLEITHPDRRKATTMPELKIDGTALTGVSETTLWTLYCRATEARRAQPLIEDPLAVEIMDRIDYDFGVFEAAGPPRSIRQVFLPTPQYFAVRALAFDRVIRDFLRRHPNGTVIALAEGLQTTFWRINSPTARWISLDLPPVIALREKLLPASSQITNLAASALDQSWHQILDSGLPTLITAEGLLMYLHRDQVHALIRDCARRTTVGGLLFDCIPPRSTSPDGWQLTPRYRTPPMTFGLTSGQARALPRQIPGLDAATTIPYPTGRGVRGKVQALLPQYPLLSHLSASVTLVEFGQTAAPRTDGPVSSWCTE